MNALFINSFPFSWLFQTDDKGVFSTSLSAEYHLAAQSFGLNKEDLWTLSADPVKYLFEDESTKEQVAKLWVQN